MDKEKRKQALLKQFKEKFYSNKQAIPYWKEDRHMTNVWLVGEDTYKFIITEIFELNASHKIYGLNIKVLEDIKRDVCHLLTNGYVGNLCSILKCEMRYNQIKNILK